MSKLKTKGVAMSAVRRTAIVVGVLFLVQTASYLIGDTLVRSAVEAGADLSDIGASGVRAGVFLQFVNVTAVIGIGVLMFPILKRFRESIALGYTATKIMEAALLLVSALFALLILPIGQAATDGAQALSALSMEAYDLAFQLAMIALGAGSLLFMYVLYKFRLVPRALSLLGAVGYVGLFVSGWLTIAGWEMATVLYVPGAVFELALPIWLIVKGFHEPTAHKHADIRPPLPETVQV